MRARRAPGHARRFHPGAFAKAEHLAADHARGIRPQQQRHAQDHRARARMRQRGDDDEERQERQAEHDIGKARHHAVRPAAEIPRDQPQQRADDDHRERRRQPDLQCRARAVDELAQHVPPARRGAEPMRGRHRQIAREPPALAQHGRAGRRAPAAVRTPPSRRSRRRSRPPRRRTARRAGGAARR